MENVFWITSKREEKLPNQSLTLIWAKETNWSECQLDSVGFRRGDRKGRLPRGPRKIMGKGGRNISGVVKKLLTPRRK